MLCCTIGSGACAIFDVPPESAASYITCRYAVASKKLAPDLNWYGTISAWYHFNKHCVLWESDSQALDYCKVELPAFCAKKKHEMGGLFYSCGVDVAVYDSFVGLGAIKHHDVDDTCCKGVVTKGIGTPGCPCWDDLSCDVGICMVPIDSPGEYPSCEAPCPIGANGCSCTAGGSCDKPLHCGQDKICACPIGAQGCDCTEDKYCDDGLTCSAFDKCITCAAGKKGCKCLDGKCGDNSLGCQDGICLPLCPPGDNGCACLPDSKCFGGSYCDNGLCFPMPL